MYSENRILEQMLEMFFDVNFVYLLQVFPLFIFAPMLTIFKVKMEFFILVLFFYLIIAYFFSGLFMWMKKKRESRIIMYQIVMPILPVIMFFLSSIFFVERN